MFSVNEYYQLNTVAVKTMRHLKKFSSLEDARVCADKAYREIIRIPEAEAVWVGVLDETKSTIVYSKPEQPYTKTK